MPKYYLPTVLAEVCIASRFKQAIGMSKSAEDDSQSSASPTPTSKSAPTSKPAPTSNTATEPKKQDTPKDDGSRPAGSYMPYLQSGLIGAGAGGLLGYGGSLLFGQSQGTAIRNAILGALLGGGVGAGVPLFTDKAKGKAPADLQEPSDKAKRQAEDNKPITLTEKVINEGKDIGGKALGTAANVAAGRYGGAVVGAGVAEGYKKLQQRSGDKAIREADTVGTAKTTAEKALADYNESLKKYNEARSKREEAVSAYGNREGRKGVNASGVGEMSPVSARQLTDARIEMEGKRQAALEALRAATKASGGKTKTIGDDILTPARRGEAAPNVNPQMRVITDREKALRDKGTALREKAKAPGAVERGAKWGGRAGTTAAIINEILIRSLGKEGVHPKGILRILRPSEYFENPDTKK